MPHVAKSTGLLLAAAILLAPAGCTGDDDAAAVTVFAAASTADYVTDIVRRFEARTGTNVRCSFGASSTLARQIERGAPADLFLSAHPAWMDRLEEAGLVRAATRRDVLENGLVLVVPAEHALGLVVSFRMDHRFDFAEAWPGRLAVADPEHVPAGVYARQALTRLGWWEDVRDRLVPTRDVRAAARLVARGEVAAGIVYASDAASIATIAVVATFPPESHDPIRYPVALGAGAGSAAERLLDALTDPDTAELRRGHGFEVPEA